MSGANRITQFLIVSPALLAPDFEFGFVDTEQGWMIVAVNSDGLVLAVIGETVDDQITSHYAISDPVKLAGISTHSAR